MVAREQTGLTTSAFYDYAEQVEERIELIEGEIFVMPSPLVRHQIIAALLTALLVNLKQGLTIAAPLDVEFDPTNVFQPDVIWISPERMHILTERRVIGAPDLVVEILSKSTKDNDKRKKFRVYQKHGVREYWIVDPEASHVEQYILIAGKLVLQDTYGADETFTSPTLGIEIAVASFIPME